MSVFGRTACIGLLGLCMFSGLAKKELASPKDVFLTFVSCAKDVRVATDTAQVSCAKDLLAVSLSDLVKRRYLEWAQQLPAEIRVLSSNPARVGELEFEYTANELLFRGRLRVQEGRVQELSYRALAP